MALCTAQKTMKIRGFYPLFTIHYPLIFVKALHGLAKHIIAFLKSFFRIIGKNLLRKLAYLK